MKFKKSMVMVLGLAVLPLCSCTSTGTSSSSSAPAASSSNPSTPSVPASSKAEKVTLNMSVMYQDHATRMKYMDDASKVTLPYAAADGNTYYAGDFKPVWAALQKNLNFTINDLTDSSSSKIADAFKLYQGNAFKVGTDLLNIAQGSSSDIIKEGTTNGTILDLSKYLDKMPSFKAFLESKPVVAKTISDANGAMYYAPYFDGFDDIERMLLVRQDWVEKLLDGDLPATLDTASTITASYTAFTPEAINSPIKTLTADGTAVGSVTKNHSANVITTQNALATKNGSTLVKALRDYIDATYGTAYGTSRSKLFVGAQSAYDVDELVALYRCVKTNPAFLTGKADNVMVPFFPRDYTNDRTADLWRFMQFFGVRGGESRNGFLYVGTDGVLHDARGEESTRVALKKLNQMYSEGLILKDFTTKGTAGFNATLLQGNTGFSSYDYNQTQTVYNDDSKCKAYEGFKYVSILPAVYNWRGGTDYFHYTESWRSVKSEGWFITAETAKDEKKLDASLKLFDYLYSDEGNQLMSFGPDGYLAKKADGTIDTIDYQGKKVAKLSDACKEELKTLAKGNYTNYYRFWIGATYPVGYIKQQGMEYQTVSATAVPALDIINKAIELGVLEHVNFNTGNTDNLYSIVPTTLAFNSAQQTSLDSFSELDAAINNTKGKANIWSDIVMKGFDGVDDAWSYDNYLTHVNSDLKCSNYLIICNAAYGRMGL